MANGQLSKIAQVMADGSKMLRTVTGERNKLAAENRELKTKLASIETRLMCEKVAAEMHEKGLNTDVDFTDLVDSLEKDAQAGKLPIIQEAVKMAAPDMGHRIAHINHDETSADGSMSDLEKFLVGSVG